MVLHGEDDLSTRTGGEIIVLGGGEEGKEKKGEEGKKKRKKGKKGKS